MSDWIEHDGTCCPVPVGTWVQAKNARGDIYEGPVSGERFSCWYWDACRTANQFNWRIIAYRLPRSRAAEDLIERIRNLEPEKEPA